MDEQFGLSRRWRSAATTYSSVVVKLDRKDDVGPFAAWVERDLDLRLQDSDGKQFALVIFVVTMFFLLISLIIISISAINIVARLCRIVLRRFVAALTCCVP